MQTGSFMEIDAADLEQRDEFRTVLEAMRAAGASYEEIDAQRQQMLNPWRRGNVYYRTYQAKDGALAVGCLSDRLRKRVADVLGLDDPRFEPGYDQFSEAAAKRNEEVAAEAETLFREKTVAEWLETFDRVGVPAGPVRYVEEMLDDEQVTANGLRVELDHSLAGRVKMVGPMIQMSQTPLEARSASPALGEHTNEILSAIGYSEADIARLRQDGVTR